MHGFAVYLKEGICLGHELSLENSADSYYILNWLHFTQCPTLFSSIYHLLHLYSWFLILSHLTQMRFYQSTHLLMCQSLETLTFVIRTGQPIPVELIDLLSSVIIFLSKINLLSWLTFLLRSLSLTHSAALLDLFFPSDAGICSTNTDLLLCTYKF